MGTSYYLEHLSQKPFLGLCSYSVSKDELFQCLCELVVSGKSVVYYGKLCRDCGEVW